MFATERTHSRQKNPCGGGVAVARGWEQFRGRDLEPPLGGVRREAWSGSGVRRHYGAEKSATSAAASEGRCGSGEPGEERLSGQYEPRDSDADERDSGNDDAGSGNELGRRAAGLFEHGEELGRIAAHASKRHFGSLEDRGGQ